MGRACTHTYARAATSLAFGLAVAGAIAGCSGGEQGETSDSGGSDGSSATSAATSTGADATTGDGSGATDMSTGSGGATGTTAGPTTAGSSTEDPFKFDVGDDSDLAGDTDDPPAPSCKVVDDMDAIGSCDAEAPPDSFEPDVQWAWPGAEGETQVVGTPVVANLTDDNQDGEVDLCDIPDVVVVAYPGPGFLSWVGHLHVIDGETGATNFSIMDEHVSALVNPALGDIDGDGIPEIITAQQDTPMGTTTGHLIAFEHDGTLKWKGDVDFAIGQNAVALADLDNDGDVEIMLGGHVADHQGVTLWSTTQGVNAITTAFAVDLDGDEDLEIVNGSYAFHHDGAPYYGPAGQPGHPQVADLDGDGEPEILVVAQGGMTLIQHDGTVSQQGLVANLAYWRPAAIHDMDGDELPEIAVGASNSYSVLEDDFSPKWTTSVLDSSGFAAGTAFDFLGDGSAEAMYADETTLFIYGENAQVLLMSPRESWTQAENPVVVDVDNDGSAEIIVASNIGYSNGVTAPVQAIRDVEDRWIQARRIWNQHAYHVTNVREDGTIPQFQPKSWQQLNTFRTQAQIASGGGVCMPDPPE